jgi:hypothetical protein
MHDDRASISVELLLVGLAPPHMMEFPEDRQHSPSTGFIERESAHRALAYFLCVPLIRQADAVALARLIYTSRLWCWGLLLLTTAVGHTFSQWQLHTIGGRLRRGDGLSPHLRFICCGGCAAREGANA